MKITNVMINLDKEKRILAYVNITFDDCFVVRGIRVSERTDGRKLLSMPSRTNKAGEYVDVCFPINNQFRQQIEKVVMNRLEDMLTQDNGSTQKS